MATTHAKNRGRGKTEAAEQELPSWREIADKWYSRSGQRITPSRVVQICRAAERKIAKALKWFDPTE